MDDTTIGGSIQSNHHFSYLERVLVYTKHQEEGCG